MENSTKLGTFFIEDASTVIGFYEFLETLF